MPVVRRLTERLARRTTRRGLLGNGLDSVFGAFIGLAAGSAFGAKRASAGLITLCIFPRALPCQCEHCLSNGTCAKPCLISTFAYAGGCWVTRDIACCDCDCKVIPSNPGLCGCGSDWHNDPLNCPDGNAG